MKTDIEKDLVEHKTPEIEATIEFLTDVAWELGRDFKREDSEALLRAVSILKNILD